MRFFHLGAKEKEISNQLAVKNIEIEKKLERINKDDLKTLTINKKISIKNIRNRTKAYQIWANNNRYKEEK